MDLQTNKDVIYRMFAAQLANDLDVYRQILADDLRWEIMQFGVDRARTKTEMIEMLGAVHRSLNGGRWDKKVISMVAEGDTVAVEATASMELANGNLYNQRYHYVYRLRQGQVYSAREYLDTLAATEAFRGLPPVASANHLDQNGTR
jgi:ketosteroid isomerase-like protein